LFFFSFFWAVLEFELNLVFTRQVLYHLNHTSSPQISFFFFFLMMVLGSKLSASYLLGRCSTALATPLPLFAVVVLGVGSCFLSRLAWTAVLVYVSCHSWDDRCVPPHPAFFFWDESLRSFFAQAVLEPQSFQSQPSHVAGSTDGSSWLLTGSHTFAQEQPRIMNPLLPPCSRD
jgi:hypothetical protein